MTAVKKEARVLSIDDILAADDLPTGTVDCPEWGGVVEVRALSRQQVVDAIEAAGDGEGGLDFTKYQIELVWRGLGLTHDRVAQLNDKHPGPIKRIELKVRELSALTEDPLD